MDLNELGPAALVGLATGVGAPLWASVLMVVINTIKAVPQFAGILDGRERLAAFVLSAVVVALAFVAALQAVPPGVEVSVAGILIAVLSWFNVARLSMALHDDVAAKPNSLTGPETG